MNPQASIITPTDLHCMLFDEDAKPGPLPLSLLLEITNSFSDERMIGSGGFSEVYKGIADNEPVAVKRMNEESMDEKEYGRELECLMKVNHSNIVRFLGYCGETQLEMRQRKGKFIKTSKEHRSLCFEYLPNGSLLDHIKDPSDGLEWRNRYKIIKGICEGLCYLHQINILHLDLNPKNILLDKNMVPKIIDFGLSRCYTKDKTYVTATKEVGTWRYLAPEFSSKRITHKYDLYSLGVVIIEIVTGEKGYQAVENVLESWSNILEISKGNAQLEQIRVCAEIGMQCIESDPAKRPDNMKQIIDRLAATESAQLSELLGVYPFALCFPFQSNKDIQCSLHLTNNIDEPVAFRLMAKGESWASLVCLPLYGIVPPRSAYTLLVVAREAKELPLKRSIDLILEGTRFGDEYTQTLERQANDRHFETAKELGNVVQEVRLKAVYTPGRETVTSSKPFSAGIKEKVQSLDPEKFMEENKDISIPGDYFTGRPPINQQNLATPQPEPRVGMTSSSNVLEDIILDESAEPTNLPLALLQHITKDFADERQIGRGGFGVVYKGDLQHGSVAVKRLLNSHTIEEEPFYREATSLISVKHQNIVRFLGYCTNTESKAMIHSELGGPSKYVFAEIRERLLCFEYINNGSLDKYLTDELTGLEWHTRYQIIRGICDGLVYLHKEKGIVHRDMKPANILLDDYMIPKITDFGISKLLEGATHAVTSTSTGSFGYCAPEFIHRGVVSMKSDIYSLGVIIIELVTGSKVDPDTKHVLRRWRYRWNKSAKYPPLGYAQITECIDIALMCLSESPKRRPYVWDIISTLNKLEKSTNESPVGPINPYPWELLEFDKLELNFPFQTNKQIPCSLELANVTDDNIAFNIEITGILQYCVEPDKGVVPPRSRCSVMVTLQPREKAPHAIMCKDELVVRCAAVDEGLTAQDITEDMFDSRSGRAVDEVALKVSIESSAIV